MRELSPILAIPLGNSGVNPECFWQFMGIAQTGVPLMATNPARTDVNRNRIADALLESDYTHVVMLDADHQHKQMIVQHFMNRIKDHPEIKVLAGLNFRRCPPYDPLMFTHDGNGTYYTVVEWDADVFPVDVVATCAICIDREVFETIDKPYFAYDYSGSAEDHYPTEDIYFCKKVREAGIKIWVDTTLVSPHLYNAFVDETVFRTYMKQQEV